MRFLKSFKYAYRGIVYCINNERNMRVHTVAMLYVLVFSLFFDLNLEKYAILLLTISAVISAEMVNTAAEELSDMTAADYNPLARIAKDVAAGAVLVCAVFAVVIGICLFWQPPVFSKIIVYFKAKPELILLLAVSFVASLFYIVLGPLGIRDKINEIVYKKNKK